MAKRQGQKNFSSTSLYMLFEFCAIHVNNVLHNFKLKKKKKRKETRKKKVKNKERRIAPLVRYFSKHLPHKI